MTRKVTCPRCGASSVYDPANKWRPFCTERCKLIDLGAWATERYRVPTDEDPNSEEPPSPTPRES